MKRAAGPLRVCRDRIGAARLEVEQVVADLDSGVDSEESL